MPTKRPNSPPPYSGSDALSLHRAAAHAIAKQTAWLTRRVATAKVLQKADELAHAESVLVSANIAYAYHSQCVAILELAQAIEVDPRVAARAIDALADSPFFEVVP